MEPAYPLFPSGQRHVKVALLSNRLEALPLKSFTLLFQRRLKLLLQSIGVRTDALTLLDCKISDTSEDLCQAALASEIGDAPGIERRLIFD